MIKVIYRSSPVYDGDKVIGHQSRPYESIGEKDNRAREPYKMLVNEPIELPEHLLPVIKNAIAKGFIIDILEPKPETKAKGRE